MARPPCGAPQRALVTRRHLLALRPMTICDGAVVIHLGGLQSFPQGSSVLAIRQQTIGRALSVEGPKVSCFHACLRQVCCVTNPIWVVKTRLELQRGARVASRAVASKVAAAAGRCQLCRQRCGREPVLPFLASSEGWGPRYTCIELLHPFSTHSSRPAPAVSCPLQANLTPCTHCSGPLSRDQARQASGISYKTLAVWQLANAAFAGSTAASTAAPYRGMADAVTRIAREEGLRGFYRGLGPSLLLVGHILAQSTVCVVHRLQRCAQESCAHELVIGTSL